MQGETEKGTAEIICNAKENVNESETEYASVEDPLNIHRTASNQTTLVSDISNIVSNENIIIAPGQGKTPVSVLSDEICEEQAFPYLFPTGKFGCNAPRDIPISPTRYFNQRLLNFNQWFASDADYIFFARSEYEQYHLCSSINFAMHKIKPGTLTAGTVKTNFKGTTERFATSDNAFSFMISVKRNTSILETVFI